MVACFAILSSCDYLENLPHVGIVTARRLVEESFTSESGEPPLKVLFDRLRETSAMRKMTLFERELYLNR